MSKALAYTLAVSDEATWSLAVVSLDAEALLGRLLSDVKSIADEIVVLDTGSNDRTRQIAESFGARVVDFDWAGDFSAARNRSFEECSSDWILWLDVDDRVTPTSLEALQKLKSSMPSEVDVIKLDHHLRFDDSGSEVVLLRVRDRIVRRSAGLQWEHAACEELADVSSRTAYYPDATVESRPMDGQARGSGEGLNILEGLVEQGGSSPHVLFNLARELEELAQFEEALRVFNEYLALEDDVRWRRYRAMILAARCCAALGRTKEELALLYNAVVRFPAWAEAWVAIGVHYYENSRWDAAIPFLAAARGLKRPQEGYVEPTCYTWAPADYLSVCHSELGMYEEALAEAVESLRHVPDRERAFRNVAFYLDKLKMAEDEPAGKLIAAQVGGDAAQLEPDS